MTGRVPDDGREIRATTHGEAARLENEVRATTHNVDTRLETVTRRGWRGLGGWWWPALLLVPLLLALFGSLLTKGGDDAAVATPTASVTASTTESATASATATATETATATATAATDNGFTLATGADGKSLTIKATVADDATKTALLDAVKAANPGVTVDDQITVAAGAAALPVDAFKAVAARVKDFPGLSITGAANAITLTGAVGSEEIKSAIGDAVKTLNPAATVDNQLTVKSTVSADCAAVNTEVAALLKANQIKFATSSATIVSSSLTDLNTIAGKLKNCLGTSGGATGLSVTGHTDSDGGDAFNMTLSQNRASAVKAALVKAGLPADKIIAKGYGETKPIGDNNTAAGKAANRRVEIVLS